MKRRALLALAVALLLAGCRLTLPPGSESAPERLPSEAPRLPRMAAGTTKISPDKTLASKLAPFPDAEGPASADRRQVIMQTTAGEVVIEVYPKAAPRSAQRFLKLASIGFYDNTPVCRVVDGYLVQFGVNWRPPLNKWRARTFKNDPPRYRVEKGTLTFAKGAPGKGGTQVQIHLRDNPRLGEMKYIPFARVVKGLEVVGEFQAGQDPNLGLDQGLLWADGGTYLRSLPEPPTMIESVRVSEPKAPPERGRP